MAFDSVGVGDGVGVGVSAGVLRATGTATVAAAAATTTQGPSLPNFPETKNKALSSNRYCYNYLPSEQELLTYHLS